MFGSIGMPEMIVIGIIALLIFGPRKLPELGKSLGKSIAEVKRASNELKNTLEDEIRSEEIQAARKSAEVPPSASIAAAVASSSLRYLRMTLGARTSSSPGCPAATSAPVVGSMTRHSTPCTVGPIDHGLSGPSSG